MRLLLRRARPAAAVTADETRAALIFALADAIPTVPANAQRIMECLLASGPLADALAALDRVQALADEWARGGFPGSGAEYAATELGRALRGDR